MDNKCDACPARYKETWLVPVKDTDDLLTLRLCQHHADKHREAYERQVDLALAVH